MDTGSGVDLVTRSAVTHASKHFEKATFTMEFNTANGKTTAHEVVKATMPPLSECIRPYVLEQTPAVLSVGLRCKKYGYAFHWFAYKQPFLITPEKKRIQLEAIDDLPILRLDATPTDDIPRQTYPGWYHEKYRWDPSIEIARLGHHNAFKGVHRWIADTGSGYDLVNKPEITKSEEDTQGGHHDGVRHRQWRHVG